MSEMGKDLGVDRMIYGKLSKTKQGWNLSLRHLTVGARPADVKTWDKQIVAGEATEEGMKKVASSAFADLRLAVEATLKALAEFTRHKDVFELVGVKSVRAFDANVVMVSVLAKRDGKPVQLVGCRIADGDPLRSAVLATLQATNRLLGPPSDD